MKKKNRNMTFINPNKLSFFFLHRNLMFLRIWFLLEKKKFFLLNCNLFVEIQERFLCSKRNIQEENNQQE